MATLRGMGQASIMMDMSTKSKFKQLAGDMPLYEYMAELADKELNNKQGRLSLVSGKRDASLSAIKADTQTIMDNTQKILAIVWASLMDDTGETIDLDKLKNLVKRVRTKIEESREEARLNQGELSLHELE